MGLDISTFTPMLEKYYSPRNVQLITFKKFPTLRLLSKRGDWTGSTYEMPIWHEASQAVGHDFTTAKGAKDKGMYDVWSLDQSKIYGFAQLDRQVMKRSMGDKRTFLRAFTAEVDGVLQVLGREMAAKIFRTRAGIRSTISAIDDGDGTKDKITLANRQDTVLFSVKMGVVASTDGTAANLRTTTYYVRRIDRSAGTIYMTATRGSSSPVNVVTGNSWAAGDSLHRAGDITSSSDTLGISGFDEWVPTSAPGSTSFYGVDRSVDTDKLGGIRVDGSGLTVEDALVEAGMRAFEAGIDVTHFVMNPLRFGYLIREAGSKMVRDEKTSALIGKTAFRVQTPAGEQTVYGDPFCQVDRIYGLNLGTWELVSSGPIPELFDDDLKMLRESDSDAYEVRMGGYGQLGCHIPGENLVIHSL